MPRHRKALAAAADTVAGVFSRVGPAAEMRRFFDEIFTPSEIRTLALRWRLLQRLRAGVPQRKIARELSISLCKITRGSRELKRGPEGFRRVVERRCGRA